MLSSWESQSCFNIIDENLCLSNSMEGMLLSSSSYNTISNNTCSSSPNRGIRLFDSNGNTIIRNRLCDNSYHGVYIQSGYSNIIWNNTFIDNNGAGSTYDPSHVQVCDGGTNNWWNGTDGYGNYWSDWTTPDDNCDGIVDFPYDIEGSAGIRDYYPRTTAPTAIPEFSSSIVVISVMIGIMAIFAGLRRLSEKNP